jgi:hypothetical protein
MHRYQRALESLLEGNKHLSLIDFDIFETDTTIHFRYRYAPYSFEGVREETFQELGTCSQE